MVGATALRIARLSVHPFALLYILAIRVHHQALAARRRDRTWRYYLLSLTAGVLAAVLSLVALLIAYAMWVVGWWWLSLLLLVLFVLPPLQPVMQRHVLVPLGYVRTSFWFGHFVSMGDSDAYGLCCAAWAHMRVPTASGEAWIIRHRDRRIPLGDAEIVVTALLAAARGDADTARQLLRSAGAMVEHHPLVRELAGEWLAVDAAERGAWAELDRDARRALWPASPLTYFLEAVAARRVDGEWAPSRFALHVRWLLAPYRRATRVLLHEAPPAPARSQEAPSPSPTGETTELTPVPALPRAVAAHLDLAARRMPDGAALGSAVAAWDAALTDGEMQRWLARRAIELDAPSGAVDRAIRDVATAVTDELARLADRASLAAPAAQGPVGSALARRLRHGRLDALEASFTRWEERRHSGAVRAPIDEWREFIALRAAYDAAVAAGGLELRRLAFPHAYDKGTSMAVWLWNSRNEHALSHAISAWLLEEALVVGDTEAIELCTRNTRLTVPTRTGNVTKS